jgi:integrase
MKGHIRERSPGHWAIVLDAPAGSDGKRKRKRKWHSFKGTKREAQKECARLLTEMQQGSYVDSSKVTVAEHVRARIAQWEGSGDISPKTAERYRELLANQIEPFIGAHRLQKLKPIDIEAWHTTLKKGGRKDGKGGISNRTIGHAHRVLSKALREAARHDLVVKNVAAEEGAPKVEDEEMIILTPDQLAELPAALAGYKIRPRAIVAVYTGMRRGELLALRWRNVDLDGKTIRIREALEETKAHGIRFKTTKTKSGRRDVSLPDIVIETLREHRKAELELRVALGLGKLDPKALVFPETPDGGGPISPRAFTGEWRDVANAIGLAGVPLHSLRHTHASQLIDAGIDVVTISKRLGHASPAITLKVYAHLFQKDDSKAADAINAALAAKTKA